MSARTNTSDHNHKQVKVSLHPVARSALISNAELASHRGDRARNRALRSRTLAGLNPNVAYSATALAGSAKAHVVLCFAPTIPPMAQISSIGCAVERVNPRAAINGSIAASSVYTCGPAHPAHREARWHPVYEIEQETERLAAIELNMLALLRSADSSSQAPPATDSN